MLYIQRVVWGFKSEIYSIRGISSVLPNLVLGRGFYMLSVFFAVFGQIVHMLFPSEIGLRYYTKVLDVIVDCYFMYISSLIFEKTLQIWVFSS